MNLTPVASCSVVLSSLEDYEVQVLRQEALAIPFLAINTQSQPVQE